MALYTSSPGCTRALTGDDDDVARRIARAVAQVYWLIELYGEAIAPFQAMGSATKRHLNAALLHQDLVMNADIAGTRFNRHARAGRQNYFDDLKGGGKFGRRNIAPHVAG